ncbi:MAG: YmfQ family protein [Clostridia bacterium]|nr:YmfQ family protein [Clostridia bacterium]
MLKKLPSYYRKSKVMQELFKSIELEFERLKDKVALTENQFFVILTDENIQNHEQDVGLTPDPSADIETRRGRVMSRLRGTGTVTKTMMKNVAASFVNGDIEIIEYPSQYCFAVKFTSRTGIPYNIADIQAMVEEIKPAHLAVEYIFTYRLWEDVIDTLQNWTTVKTYTWDEVLVFEHKKVLNITDEGAVYYTTEETGNGTVVWDGTNAYARRNE